MNLRTIIREVPDFPKEGILFYDITPILTNPAAFKYIIDQFVNEFKNKGITKILAPEARGFIFATPLAFALNTAFVPIRKPGKLLAETISAHYDLEYGSNSLEMHKDALSADDKVLIIDDLLATGGTINAIVELVKTTKAEIVGLAFVCELDFLNPRKLLANYPITTLLHITE